jgi:hypothetical protein
LAIHFPFSLHIHLFLRYLLFFWLKKGSALSYSSKKVPKEGRPMLRWWLYLKLFSSGTPPFGGQAFRNSLRCASVSFGFPLEKSWSSYTNSAKGIIQSQWPFLEVFARFILNCCQAPCGAWLAGYRLVLGCVQRELN